MKILHVIPSLGIGGTEKMLFELCRGLDASKFSCEVVALKSGGAAERKLADLGVPVSVIGSPEGLALGTLALPYVYLKLKSKMRGVSPDIVHTWLSRADVLGRLAARGAGLRNVVSSLRVVEFEKGYHLWAEKWTEGLARVVTVNSSELKDFAVQKIGIPAGKVQLIPNGIDVSKKADPNLTDTYNNRWLKPGKLTLGAMGRLHRQKGMDVLLGAAQFIHKQHPNVHLVIAGDGPEKNNLVSLSKRLGIDPYVTFCGWVEGSLEFMSMLDIFILPSRWEGMPNAVMEAMLCEKPVITTRVSGISELIDHEKEGLVVPSEDPGRLAEAINRLVNDAAFRRSLAVCARQKILNRFDLKKMIAEYEKLYESFKN